MAAVRSIFLKILGVFGSLLLALAIAEGAVRLISPQEVGPVRFACNPELGEIPVPGQHGERKYPGGFIFKYSNNSLGWRGSREYRQQKQTKYRVLFLGDSFTYGLGVNDNQTFPARVEKKLQASDLSAEVMNAGCPGKGTDYELKLFQTVGYKFHPDLTVLAFFCNDFQDNGRGEYYNINKQGKLEAKTINCSGGMVKAVLTHLPGYNWLISWSEAANLVKQASVDFIVSQEEKNPRAADGLVVTYKRTDHGYSNRANRELTQIYVHNLRAAVQHAGGSMMMFYIPISQEVSHYRRTDTISADERAIRRIAADNGMMLWSLTPLLAHSGQPIDRLYYKEGHWTAAAHKLAAQYMSRLIERRLTSRP
ncbi:MAG TPA: GDSL-type esterase/lipase family protein [Desulfobaccales bacterium]|nr:GDSL-type esterase/lipase family protein [Desulfobaccales bacterium]